MTTITKSWQQLTGPKVDTLALRRVLPACVPFFNNTCHAFCFGGGVVDAPASPTPVLAGDSLTFLNKLRASNDFVLIHPEKPSARILQPGVDIAGQDWPAPRMQATLTAWNGEYLVLLGGIAFTGNMSSEAQPPMLDPWVFSKSQNRWLRVITPAAEQSEPQPRFGHAAFALSEGVVMLGGCGTPGIYSCDKAVDSIAAHSWLLVLPPTPPPVADGQPATINATWRLLDDNNHIGPFANGLTLNGGCGVTESSSLVCTTQPPESYVIMWAANKSLAGPVESLFRSIMVPDEVSPLPQLSPGFAISASLRSTLLTFGGFPGIAFSADVWQYSIANHYWQSIVKSEVAPANLILSAAARVNDRVLSFGGVAAGGTVSSELWALDLNTSAWYRIANTVPVGSRYAATLTEVFPGQVMIIGGQSNGWDSDSPPGDTSVWGSLNVDQGNSWLLLHKDGVPSARFGHSAVKMQLSNGTVLVVVFGGWMRMRGADMFHGDAYNDLWVFSIPNGSLESGHWMHIPTPPQYDDAISSTHQYSAVPWPAARAFHSAVSMYCNPLGRHVMVVAGGFVQNQFGPIGRDDHIWALDVETWTWRFFSPTPLIPLPILAASLAPSDTRLFIHGGLIWDEVSWTWVTTTDVLVGGFDSDETWLWTKPDFEPAQHRMGASIVTDGLPSPSVIEFGGVDFGPSGLVDGLPVLKACKLQVQK